MRNNVGNIERSRAIALVILALAAASCSRSLPTSPASTAVNSRVGADAFATVGLENQVVVTLAPGADAASIAAEYGAVLVNTELDERTAALRPVAGQTPAALMAALQLDGRIQTAEPNGWIQPAEVRQQSFAFDDGFGGPQVLAGQPAATMLHLDEAQNIATGKGVKVAIIDTGADLTHPMLRNSIVGGWDFVDNDADPTDKRNPATTNAAYGHGTHIAGIVHLVAPDAQLLIVRVLDASGRGDFVNVAAGVRWAIEQGAKVINLSLGVSGTGTVDVLQNVIEDPANAGIIFVTAAGNQASRNVDFPGRSSSVIDVAAVVANGAGATFSSFDHSNVTLSAPGVAVRSTYPGSQYRLWSGTSMAAPFVTGAAALLAQLHPTWTMLEIAARLQGTSTAIVAPAPNGADITRDFGSGTLNIGAALAPDFVPGPNQNPGGEDIRPH